MKAALETVVVMYLASYVFPSLTLTWLQAIALIILVRISNGHLVKFEINRKEETKADETSKH
jgi:hypothetical protein